MKATPTLSQQGFCGGRSFLGLHQMFSNLGLLCLSFTVGCVREPLPASDLAPKPEEMDLRPDERPDQIALDIRPALGDPEVLVRGLRGPSLDGVTQSGMLAYHDGSDCYVVNTNQPKAPLKLCQGYYATIVAPDAIIELHEFQNGVSRLSSFRSMAMAAVSLDSRAIARRSAISVSPSSKYVGFVRVADPAGEVGHLQIRLTDGTGASVSPMELRDLDLLKCPPELQFYDDTTLIISACQKGKQQGLFAVHAESGQTTPLSEPKEAVEQMAFVQGIAGARIAWVNQPTAGTMDPSMLKSVLVDGTQVKSLQRNMPRKAQAQLKIAPSGTLVYYLTASGALERAALSGGGIQVLSTEKVDRFLGISPDGMSLAVARVRAGRPDRLSILDTSSKESIDPPVPTAPLADPIGFSSDSSVVLYLSGTSLLSHPVRGTSMGVTLLEKAVRFVPLPLRKVLVFHDEVAAESTVSVIDAVDPRMKAEKARGLSRQDGAFVLGFDRSKLFYVKGDTLYGVALP